MTVFIHGYGTNISSDLQQPLNQYKGLKLAQHFANFEAFEWSIPATFSSTETRNPLKYLDLYLQEQQKSQQTETLLELNDFLHRTQPATILCHSLGCELLLNYLENHNLPDDTQEVVFLQPNTDAFRKVENRHFLDNVVKGKIAATSYFCPWDTTLMIGSIVNLKISAGLLGFRSGPFTNVFLPALTTANHHSACLSEPKLLKHFHLRPTPGQT